MTRKRSWEWGAGLALLAILGGAGALWLHRRQLPRRLTAAVEHGNADAVARLLAEGADPNTRTTRGDYSMPVVLIAAHDGRTDILQLLLDRGASVDAEAERGDTALIEAAGAGRTEAARLLLDRGATINHMDAVGITPLINAAWREHPDCVRLLVARGADVQAHCRAGTAVRLVRKLELYHVHLGARFHKDLVQSAGEAGRTRFGTPAQLTADEQRHASLAVRDRQLVAFLKEHGARE